MIVNTRAVVLSSLKYNDTSLIVKCFTQSDGIKSYLLKGILTSKRGRLKTAYFQPLMQLEIVARHKNKGTLESIHEVKPACHYNTLHSNLSKNALCIFLSEMLSFSIYEEEQNIPLFNYLEYSLTWLDNNETVANFHISFLLGLTKYLGFSPDEESTHLPFFDLQEGIFSHTKPLTPYIEGNNLKNFRSFLGIIFDDIHNVKMNNIQRLELLNTVILYFELHLHGFRKPKSLQVLSQVFH
ncbi:DNA repair protein RecO [Abyssalbus ytuae]|uniref:DNA repair protein RecO n=1 Tax=Abyssalbus ytuae TaxID=2926907 RepID=A0A9E7CUY9_9FLAO|nr:DNA repair protein RecO [Abyssalbus ytuae]UOB19152.1 DNA repair protein RecO [Abyssalbus ytuae]